MSHPDEHPCISIFTYELLEDRSSLVFLAHMGMKFIFSRSINCDQMKYSINYLKKKNKAIYSHCGIINSALFEKASHPLAPAVSMATLSHVPLSSLFVVVWNPMEAEGTWRRCQQRGCGHAK